ncbi:MAG: ATP-binding protein, partial [Solirubrobacteraceae bacterium]
MAMRVSSRELIGRANELALLMSAVEAARVGAGQTVLVAGEADVGKSRLLAEVGRQARAAGATVLIGGCVDLADAELSYAPIVGALRGVVRDLSEPEIVRLLGAARAELARLLPELGKPPAGDPVAGGQARLFELILGVLGRLGSEQPMLLVLEDLHWADAPSLDLLSFLITNQRSERLAIVASLRTSELAPEHRLMKELRRSAAVQRIELEPLTRTEVAAQVASITGSEPKTGIVDRLYERSQGNPFFVEELLAAGEDALPASLRDALLARVRPLSDQARALLSLAAVAGRTVDHRLLAGVSQLADRELIGAPRETVTSHLLVSDGLRYAFRHALLREAVYADLLAGERVPLHAALATALQAHPELAEARATVAAEIAHHWSAAGIEERALAASVQAAAEAEGIYSMAEAGR